MHNRWQSLPLYNVTEHCSCTQHCIINLNLLPVSTILEPDFKNQERVVPSHLFQWSPPRQTVCLKMLATPNHYPSYDHPWTHHGHTQMPSTPFFMQWRAADLSGVRDQVCQSEYGIAHVMAYQLAYIHSYTVMLYIAQSESKLNASLQNLAFEQKKLKIVKDSSSQSVATHAEKREAKASKNELRLQATKCQGIGPMKLWSNPDRQLLNAAGHCFTVEGPKKGQRSVEVWVEQITNQKWCKKRETELADTSGGLPPTSMVDINNNYGGKKIGPCLYVYMPLCLP